MWRFAQLDELYRVLPSTRFWALSHHRLDYVAVVLLASYSTLYLRRLQLLIRRILFASIHVPMSHYETEPKEVRLCHTIVYRVTMTHTDGVHAFSKRRICVFFMCTFVVRFISSCT